jgi:hypothetical protein
LCECSHSSQAAAAAIPPTGDDGRRDISAKLALLEMRLEAHGHALPLNYREGVIAKLSGR